MYTKTHTASSDDSPRGGRKRIQEMVSQRAIMASVESVDAPSAMGYIGGDHLWRERYWWV